MSRWFLPGGLRIAMFLFVLSLTPVLLASREAPRESAYGAPVSVAPTAVATWSPPAVSARSLADDPVRRPAGPSSLALLAIGLGFLFFVRARQWVR